MGVRLLTLKCELRVKHFQKFWIKRLVAYGITPHVTAHLLFSRTFVLSDCHSKTKHVGNVV